MSAAKKSNQVAEELERRIRAGVYAPGEKLPTVAELAEEFQTAKNTAHTAIRTLVRKGMAVTYTSVGTLVLDWRRPRQIRRARAVYKDDEGFYFDEVAKPWVRVTPKSRVSWETVENEVADHFGIPYGSEVLVREIAIGEQVEIAPGRMQVNPKQVCSTTVPADIAREYDLGREDTGKGGVLCRLEEAFKEDGRVRFTDVTYARLPTDHEVEVLQLGGRDVVILVNLVKMTATVDGVPRVVAINNTRMDGRHWSIEHELRVTSSAK